MQKPRPKPITRPVVREEQGFSPLRSGGDEISLSDLEEGLSIDEHALEESCAEQPELFYRVAKQLALAISRRDQMKQHLEEAEAEIDSKVRHDAEVAEEKVREGEIKSEILRHPRIRQARVELLRYQARVGELQALKESFGQRSYALNHMVDLYVTRYHDENIDRGSGGDVRSVNARKARQAMAEERRRRDNEH